MLQFPRPKPSTRRSLLRSLALAAPALILISAVLLLSAWTHGIYVPPPVATDIITEIGDQIITETGDKVIGQ